MAARTSDRLAVLIDAENAQASVFQFLLAEINRYGTATTRPTKLDSRGCAILGFSGVFLHLPSQADCTEPLRVRTPSSRRAVVCAALTTRRTGL